MQVIKIRRDWYNSGRVEADHPRGHFVGQQGLGRSGFNVITLFSVTDYELVS